jgi:DNA-binding transcriptional LysR family regulator
VPKAKEYLDPDGDLDLRSVRYFLAAVDHRDLDRAAAAVATDQETLSHAIASLEERLGTLLLTSHHSGFTLTIAGAALVPEANVVLHRAATARRVVRTALDATTLRIGSGPYALLDEALARYGQARPDITIYNLRSNDGEQTASLLAGSIDLALVRLPTELPDVRIVELLEDPQVVMVPTTHRLASADQVAQADLTQERLLDYDGVPDAPAQWHKDTWSWNMDPLLDAVAAGEGLLLLPQSMAASLQRPDLTWRVANDAAPYRLGLALIADRPTSPEVDTFIEIAVDTYRHGLSDDVPSPWVVRSGKLPSMGFNTVPLRGDGAGTVDLAVQYQDKSHYSFPRQGWRWVDVRRYTFDANLPHPDALAALIDHPYFADSYLYGGFGGRGSGGEIVHGPYFLDAIDVDSFIDVPAVAAVATLDAFLAWGSPPATRADVGVDSLIERLEAATAIRYLTPKHNSRYANSWPLGEFEEFIAFSSPGELLQIALGED